MATFTPALVLVFLLLLSSTLVLPSAQSSEHQVLDVTKALGSLHQELDDVVQPGFDPESQSESESSSSSSSSSTAAATEWIMGETEQGLKLRLMHRDAKASPLRKPGGFKTAADLITERLARDAARVSMLSKRAAGVAAGVSPQGFNGPVVSGLAQGSGEYFTRLGVGTPARQSFMVLDTGSDILWMQCSPCHNCYQQSDPIFNPALSRSYRTLPCRSLLCRRLDLRTCQPRTGKCQYQVAYGDGSFTAGEFALETLSFRGASIPGVALGCGRDNEGLFAGAAGLLGLGGGSLSFPSQLATRGYPRRFSYCLAGAMRASDVTFGDAAVPRGTRFTPLLRNPRLSTFYYVSLTGISVGGALVTAIPPSAFHLDSGTGNGGVIIDSGTSITRLVETAYGPLRSAYRVATRNLPFIGGYSLFDTCYNLAGKTRTNLPAVVFHFEGGADLHLPASNCLIPVDTTGTFCLAFASTMGGLSIIGNVQQQGFRVVFDGPTSRLGFAPNQCG